MSLDYTLTGLQDRLDFVFTGLQDELDYVCGQFTLIALSPSLIA